MSNTGTWMQRIAQDWLVLELTGSALAVGVTIAVQFLPLAVLGLYGGLVADRASRRLIMIITQAVMAVLATVLAVLTLMGSIQAWQVVLIAALLGVTSAFENPARQTFVNEMVPQELVRNAVSLNVGNFHLARMAGPAVAGLLISAVGSGWAFAINAASYLAVLGCLFVMRTGELYRQPSLPRGKGQLREALDTVKRTPILRWAVIVVFFVGALGFNFAVILASYAMDVFASDAGLYGWLNTAMAVGSVAGALFAARRSSGTLAALFLLAGAFSVGMVLLGLVTWLPAFLVLLPMVGFVAVAYSSISNASVQMATEPDMRGRVMSLYMLVFIGASPAGSLLVGWVTEVWGAPLALIGSGVACGIAVSTCAVLAAHRAGLSMRAEVRERTLALVHHAA